MPADDLQCDSAPIIGRVPFFNYNEKSWNVFEVQLEQFLIANNITEEKKKKAILITSLSEGTYVLLQNLLSPVMIGSTEATFNMCVMAMKAHFKPATSGFAERFKFYCATMSPSESINDWAVRVRELATYCEFGTHLETAIRDKFVMGLEKGPAIDKIFLEPVTTRFERVKEIANNAEYVLHQYQKCEVKREADLNYIKKRGNVTQQKNEQQQRRGQKKMQQSGNEGRDSKQQQQQHKQQQCTVCGFTNHISADCKFKNYKCNLCKQRGHLKKMCSTSQNLNFLNNEELSLFSMRGCNDGPIKIKICVNGSPFTMELDTGSEYNVISDVT